MGLIKGFKQCFLVGHNPNKGGVYFHVGVSANMGSKLVGDNTNKGGKNTNKGGNHRKGGTPDKPELRTGGTSRQAGTSKGSKQYFLVGDNTNKGRNNTKCIKKLLLCCLFLFCVLVQVQAQNQVRPHPYGQWLMYFGDNKINKKIGIHSELQLRNYFLEETVEQTLMRIGVNYYVDPLVMLSGGYGFIHTTPSAQNVVGFTTREHRIWQQLILRHKTRAIFMEHRYRLEQRFIENITDKTNTFDNRLRYRFQTILPFYTLSPHLRHYFFNAYNEFFVNLGREVSGQIFDRNRLYFALGYQVSPKLNFQIGYLNQVISIPGNLRPDINHNLQIGVAYNMDDIMATFFNKQ